VAVPLLIPKLYIPPVRPESVLRLRLIEHLNAGLRAACKLKFISAPVGFGKTTLLAERVRDCRPRLRVAWVSLDESDDNPGHFLAYAISALQTVEPDLVQSAVGTLQGDFTPDLDVHPPTEFALQRAFFYTNTLIALGKILNVAGASPNKSPSACMNI
jgi:ATP/maltotriose-dependent transcriptional regulator MalT